MTRDEKHEPGKRGKTVATIGAVMIAGSVLLALVGIGGPTLHNVLVFGGVGLGVIGIVLWRIVKV